MTRLHLLATNDSDSAILDTLTSLKIEEDEYRHIIEEFMHGRYAFDPTDETIVWIIWTLLAIAGLCSNLVVILLILLRRSFYNTNILLVFNLCLADLLYIAFSVPINLISILRRHYPFGETFCKITPFVQANAFFVTASTVTTIALDRQFSILNAGANSQKTIAGSLPSHRFRSIIIIWITATLSSLPVLVFQRFQQFKLGHGIAFHLCIENWPTSEARIAYYFLTYSVFSLVPTITLGLTYYNIKKFLEANLMDKRSRWHFLPRSGMTLKEIRNFTKVFDFFEGEINRNTKVSVVLLIGFLAFIISWLPLSLYNLFIDFYHTRIPLSTSSISRLLVICHTIAIISVTTNAIIYGFMNTNIQRQIGSFSRGKWIGI